MYEAYVDLPGVPSSVADARRFARGILDSAGMSDDDWAVVQVVSELATNAVLHAGTPFRLAISYDAVSVRVEVTDTKPLVRAAVRRFSNETTTGRGLRLVQMLGRAWGVNQDDGAKTVWCELNRGAVAVADIEGAYEVLGRDFDDDEVTARAEVAAAEALPAAQALQATQPSRDHQSATARRPKPCRSTSKHAAAHGGRQLSPA